MKKISINDLDSLGIEKLSRENLQSYRGGASQCWMEDGVLNCCPDGLLYNPAIALCDLPENVSGGGPGGNNGNPCPEYCEPFGGTIVCTRESSGSGIVLYMHNCNQLDWNYVQQQNLHNYCLNHQSGSFWC